MGTAGEFHEAETLMLQKLARRGNREMWWLWKAGVYRWGTR